MSNNKLKYLGAKRLMLEAQELKDNTEDYCAQPLDDNLFEWHFTVRGPPDSVFQGGFYHGRLSFPTEYPMKPPSIILLTPNGRFKTDRKICLSISGYHPETWQPSWSVRTALLALIAFMPTKANGAIGSLDFPDAERRRLAIKSRSWRCEHCGLIKELLIPPQCGMGTSQTISGECSASNSIGNTSKSADSDSGVDCTGDTSSPEIEISAHNEHSDNPRQTSRASQSTHKSAQTSKIGGEHGISNQISPPANSWTSFSSLVLMSIFIILLLLSIRRILMIIP